jgi:hypothetical protein
MKCLHVCRDLVVRQGSNGLVLGVSLGGLLVGVAHAVQFLQSCPSTLLRLKVPVRRK